MFHSIEGPYLNHSDPWRKNNQNGEIFQNSGVTSQTVYLPEFTLSFVSGSKNNIKNIPCEIEKPDYEYVLVLQLTGDSEIILGSQNIIIKSGEMTLLSSRDDWIIGFSSDYSQIVIRFHYAYITPLITVKDIPLFVPFLCTSGVGLIFKEYLIRMKIELDNRSISQSSSVAISRSLINLILACILEINSKNNQKKSATYEYHISRIKNFIAQNLREPTLSMEVISEALTISIPHLHRIFKNEPMSISHYIWSKRLQGSVKDLSEYSKSNLSISTIAFSWGFNDAAHFSRVFKEQYGISPSLWRKQKLAKS